MNRPEQLAEWLQKAKAKIEATPRHELYKQLFGFYEADYESYIADGQFETEMQYVIDTMTKMGITEINIYDGDMQPPTKFFFHHLRQTGVEGYDEKFWDGYGAEYLRVPEFPVRYLWVNGQGTEHYFRLMES